MAIEFPCLQCGKQLRVQDESAGKQARCPHCGAISQIPHAATVVPAFVPEIGPNAPASESESLDFNPYESPTTTAYAGSRRRTAGGFPLASLGARFGGAFLDLLFTVLAMLPGIFLLFATVDMGDVDEDFTESLEFLAYVYPGALIYWIINWILITQTGQSVGKRIVGTRIVKLDGSPPGFVNGVLLRSIVPGIIGAIPYIGNIFGLVDVLFIFGAERRCIHDHMASTQVVEA